MGPPKTATGALQRSVIPYLGRPYLFRPPWTKALARGLPFDPPGPLSSDIILSDERLGDFAFLAPSKIAAALSQFLPKATVVFINRDPLQQFYSFYRQGLQNSVAISEETRRVDFITPDQFFDQQRVRFARAGCGFFAMTYLRGLAEAFRSHKFEFETVDFALLKTTPMAFVEAFSNICGSAARPEIIRAGVSSHEMIDGVLNTSGNWIPPEFRARLSDLYAFSRLSPDREDFLKNWRDLRAGKAFTEAFRFIQPK
jgi:hypothetical protein